MEYLVVALLAGAAFIAVAFPLLRSRPVPVDAASDAPLEQEVARYRAAVRADTLCARCGQANPPGSRYCFECGRTLPRIDAQEFDGPGEGS